MVIDWYYYPCKTRRSVEPYKSAEIAIIHEMIEFGNHEKGKPGEILGRKAMGLRSLTTKTARLPDG